MRMTNPRRNDSATAVRRLAWLHMGWVVWAALSGVLGLALATFAAAQTPTVAPADPVRYLNNIKALTTTAMEGRGDGMPGLERAAHLLEQQYKSLGLEPAGTQGFFQPFQVSTGAKLTGKNEIAEQRGGARKELKLNEDFTPFSFSSSGEVSAAVVFAGYGVTAPEFGYDDCSRRWGCDGQDRADPAI